MHADGRPKAAWKPLIIVGKLILWAVVLFITALPVIATWNRVLMARGSDSATSIYHVQKPAFFVALAVWGACSFLFFLSRPRITFPLRRYPGRNLFIVFALGFMPMGLCYHAITISAKHGGSELTEFIGPISIRLFQAPEEEIPLQAECDYFRLKILNQSGGHSTIWLGLWPWSIPQQVCNHLLLETSGKVND